MLALGFELPAMALRRAAPSSSPVPFSPLQLAPSAMFDPSNMPQLFQDDAGTTAVTADNQPVGLWRDETVNGVDMIQAVSAARPSYRTDGTHHWIETDGVDDALATAASLRVGNPLTMVFGVHLLTTLGTSRVNIAEISRTKNNGISIGPRANNDRMQVYSRLSDQGVSASHVVAPSIWGGHQPHVVTLQTAPGNVTVRLDGVEVMNTSQNLATETIEPHPLRIGLALTGGSIPGAFKLFGLQVWDGTRTQPNPSQIDALEQWMADKVGVII
jgi:hypothetical protein